MLSNDTDYIHNLLNQLVVCAADTSDDAKDAWNDFWSL